MKATTPRLRRLIMLPLLALFLAACSGEAEPAVETTEETPSVVDTTATGAVPSGMQDKLNLNTATEEDFRTIPGVGDRMIGEFLEYRPYVSITQFRREIGKYVDEEQVATYEEYVYVPIDPDESDAATLQQLPGVDEGEAEELIAGRPYASQVAFLERLAEYVSAEELAQAERMLDTP